MLTTKVNLEEGTYKGKKIKDMSRQEIIKAWHDTNSLYQLALKDNNKLLKYESPL